MIYRREKTAWLIVVSRMAAARSPMHTLFLKSDTDIPPIERWGLCSFPLNTGRPMTAAGVTLGHKRPASLCLILLGCLEPGHHAVCGNPKALERPHAGALANSPADVQANSQVGMREPL